ncbi:Pimeloyl-ACP methyl ester carboxylesterase [Nakamurella panacisegetis]|uniref:Pimeloyl-ACP methyl ester carboxylesterase n=1 Tax=Nakamurella panacisegetis TaxID=1090615 RepID=A0A1H0JWK3_9ACTN|nr:alpha/beta hydrolase [Nakamurella panacisegetis]SDO48014.1 Pimeloyl-ACP methyl ester carboxylesterase [Nakamurella panacisegetis]
MSVDIVSANGIDLAYETFGDPADVPVLLIMGLSTQMLAWRTGFCQALAERGHFVIRFDNRDVGFSTHFGAAGPGKPIGSFLGLSRPAYRLTDMGRDAAGLIEALGLPGAHVVGVSMGGMIAQNLVLLRPDLVRSLTSLSSTTGALPVGKPHPEVLWLMMRAKPAADREGAIAASTAMYSKIRSPGFPSEIEAVRDLSGQSYDRCYDPAGGTRQFAAILAAPDRTAALQRVAVPTTVIHGNADPLINLSGGRATAAAIKGSRFVVIDGMGHDIPTPAWSRLIDEISATVVLGERAAARPVRPV